MEPQPGEVTELLAHVRAGESGARERLYNLIYFDLRRLAAARMRSERPGHTLSPTALVNEAYLRLAGNGADGITDRGHFLAVASQAMRRVLVDHARARDCAKRNKIGTASPGYVQGPGADEMTVALDEALRELEEMSPRQSRVVEMRYFAGLTETEVAASLGITRRTASRDWQIARAWLHARLGKFA